MSSEEESVKREMKIHGMRWGSFHHHYFASPKVAEPLVEAILSAVDAARPDVIADLGGGTGFLLKELLRRRPLPGVRLVDVDVSDLQLSACDDERIERLTASASTVVRRDLGVEDRRLLLVARSLLHYFGCLGLSPLLRHLRGQLRPGELFVHQSACFADREDAVCLNRVYEMMKTEKWYFTIDELEAALEVTGFSLCEVRPAPPLRLDSGDLAERYELSAELVASIRKEVVREFGERPGVFTSSSDGFTAWLHYSIFVCRAV
jgi:predicted TPR repeat methyltransferase